jgi:radical SAM protein with 4Fe4S-binding SPASM domain
LIDAHSARWLAALRVRVKISLDGVTAETHDFLRGSGTFAKTLEALSWLRAAGAEGLTVHYTVHRKNCAELPRLPAFLSTLGVRTVVVGLIKPSGRATVNDELLIPPSMVPYVRQKIEALAHNDAIILQRFSDRGWEGFGCPATCNKFGITATGRVTTCAFFGQELLGESIRNYALATLWEQHIMQDSIFVANEHCAHCPNLEASGGGCRARAWYYSGDLNGIDPECCALYQKKLFLDKHRTLLRKAVQCGDVVFVSGDQ